jgi:epoxyqueuosine reductase
MRLDDPDRVRPLLLRLGRRGDARALPPLLALLETVRSRPDVVQALGLLGDRRAVPAVAELLASDPYVPVRAAAATALGQLGGPAATAALRSASSHEREPLARAAITAALAGK